MKPLPLALMALLLLVVPVQGLPVALRQGHVTELVQVVWRDAAGTEHVGVSGRGVVALETEGFDALHPDLVACSDPDHHILGLGVPPILGPGSGIDIPVPFPFNDNNNHGTMIAGVICGDGTQSGGELHGIAPNATLYSIGTTITANISSWFDVIRVVTRSTSGEPLGDLRFLGMPADEPVLVAAAVGNDGGDGTQAETSAWLHSDPRILGVAAANGLADGVASSSSRGARNDPATWPDLTAPGCMVTTARLPDAYTYGSLAYGLGEIPDCHDFTLEEAITRKLQGYEMQKGTSFASPFVAGVALLVLEVNPALTPADLSYLLTRTADAFLPTNDTNGDGRVSPEEFYLQHGWEAGWGLVNATAAVAAAHYLAIVPDASLEQAIACGYRNADTNTLNEPVRTCHAVPRDPQAPLSPESSLSPESGHAAADGQNPDDLTPPGDASKSTPAPVGLVLIGLACAMILRRSQAPRP